MLNLHRSFLSALTCLTIALAASAAATAATVNVDVAAKLGKSDVDTIDVKIVKVSKEQAGTYMESTLLTPQTLKVVFSGIKDEDYDLYVNGSYVGVKTSKALKEGIEQTIPGTVADETAMRCLKALSPKVAPAHEKVRAIKGAEPWRAAYTLGMAKDWVASGIRADQKYRSLEMIIVPAGRPMEKMAFAARQDAKDTAATVLRSCKLLHQARARMYDVLTDADLRNQVVDALTPVEFSVSYLTNDGRPCVTASLTNFCDMPITGKIELPTVKGWKFVGAKLDIGTLQPGKTFTSTFNLESSYKTAAPPESLLFTAVVDVARDDLAARLWLYATGTLSKP